MPSPRRMRLLMLATVITFVFVILYTSGSLESGPEPGLKDFYHKTKEAMDRGHRPGGKDGHVPADRDGDGDVDEDDNKVVAEVQRNLKESEKVAKDNANAKGGMKPDPPSEVVGMGSSRQGQGKKGVSGDSKAADVKKDVKEAPKETEEEHKVEVELNRILKQSPVIIFSKSYCPHSKRAKGILLEKYIITPAPYVVELDEHPLGEKLQDILLAKTNRRTVPNIMVNAVSIGGADNIVELDKDDKLIAKVLELGNTRVKISERLNSHS